MYSYRPVEPDELKCRDKLKRKEPAAIGFCRKCPVLAAPNRPSRRPLWDSSQPIECPALSNITLPLYRPRGRQPAENRRRRPCVPGIVPAVKPLGTGLSQNVEFGCNPPPGDPDRLIREPAVWIVDWNESSTSCFNRGSSMRIVATLAAILALPCGVFADEPQSSETKSTTISQPAVAQADVTTSGKYDTSVYHLKHTRARQIIPAVRQALCKGLAAEAAGQPSAHWSCRSFSCRPRRTTRSSRFVRASTPRSSNRPSKTATSRNNTR